MKAVLLIVVMLAVAALSAPSPKNPRPKGSRVFDRYWSLDEIYDFMRELEENFPEITEVEQMGRTSEGRDILGLRITNEEHLGRESLPVVFVTAGLSARDWISVMSAVDIMHELVEHYEDFRHIVDDAEWFVIPCANPDGYEFSRQSAANRAWVKNRVVNEGSGCLGVNIDRNFDFNWGLQASSSEPCNNNFRGTAPDSEEETKTIQFAVDLTRRIQRAYITIKAGEIRAHSLIAFPYSSNNELFNDNWSERIAVANIMAERTFEQTGVRFISGSESTANIFQAGTSADYAAGRDNIPLAYTIHAPRGGANGWDVPESDINRIVDEVFFAVEAVGEYIADVPLPQD